MRPERGPSKALIRSDNFEQQLNVKPFISMGKEGNIYSLLAQALLFKTSSLVLYFVK
jgi:hypothetical protein